MSTMLLGIDVSHAQGDVDFARVRDAGFRFCICKATEGADYQDASFVTNLQRICDLGAGTGFYPGAYHFARPDHHAGRSGGETEAKWFCKVLKATASQLDLSLAHDFIEPVLDMETYDESDTSDNLAWIQGFVAVVQEETGRTGMIYSGPNYWRYQLGDTDVFAESGIPLWEVKYTKSGSDPAQAPPRMPNDPNKAQWTASLWQWSGGGDYAYYNAQSGAIAGVPGGIADVSRVMSDESLLTRLTAASTTTAASSASTSQAGTATIASLPTFDLRDRRGRTSTTIARVQGLLLSHGFGPQGLVASATGRPDSIDGSATEAAFSAFKRSVGLPADTMLDQATWQRLVGQGLD